MKLLDRYIAGAVITGTAIALLVILGLNIFFEIIRQIDDVGKGTYTLATMLQYVALTLPLCGVRGWNAAQRQAGRCRLPNHAIRTAGSAYRTSG